ncbi:DNA cytosine methyltransferase [Desulfovibrio sp.]|uniref:DNA cytosine methyltransferase n=1 Tax=Desulfovibrio sp. TaxID=885 RepID=UPI0025BD63A3|nr:DNA cytosine methyltransferase [Desulfovibrio sp.]
MSGGENMIDFGNGTYRHYTKREAARLQDMDDAYEFPCSWGDSLKQLGNAVPGALSYAFGGSVAQALAA